MSLWRELAYAVVPPVSEEPRRGVNHTPAEAGCFGNGASASIASVARFADVISEHSEAEVTVPVELKIPHKNGAF